MIKKISILFEQQQIKGNNIFHPSFAPMPDDGLMFTFQTYTASDHYGSPQFMIYTPQNGWSVPADVPGMENVQHPDGSVRGVADIRIFAAGDGSVVVFGCGTIYGAESQKGNINREEDFSLYNIYKPGTGWGECQRLPVGRIACTQTAFAADGDWLVPCYFVCGEADDFGMPFIPRYGIRTLKLHLGNGVFNIVGKSNILQHNVQRGFIEPSISCWNNEYYLTIRAEDGCAYVSKSADPLHWCDPVCGQFDDGAVMQTASTQQHFLQLEDKLFLLYTRKSDCNEHVFRYRAPLFIAEIDGRRCCLKRSSEKIVFDYIQRNGVDGLLGNFHVCNLPDGSGIVCDCRLFDSDNESLQRHAELAVARIDPAAPEKSVPGLTNRHFQSSLITHVI